MQQITKTLHNPTIRDKVLVIQKQYNLANDTNMTVPELFSGD